MNSLIRKIFRFLSPERHPCDVKKEYGIPDTIGFSISRKPSGWFVITSPDLPGLISQSEKLDDLMEIYNDAILTYFDVPKKESDYVFNELDLKGVGTLKLSKDGGVRYA